MLHLSSSQEKLVASRADQTPSWPETALPCFGGLPGADIVFDATLESSVYLEQGAGEAGVGVQARVIQNV